MPNYPKNSFSFSKQNLMCSKVTLELRNSESSSSLYYRLNLDMCSILDAIFPQKPGYEVFLTQKPM